MRPDDRKLLMDLLLRAKLSDQEFVVLARRYGLDEQEPVRAFQLARMMNLLEFEVKRICRVGMMKLREVVSEKDRERFDRLMIELIPPIRIKAEKSPGRLP